MQSRTYDLYVGTFRRAQEGLRAGDDHDLRVLCMDIAGRSGIESTVSLMAVSDAECGRGQRARGEIFRRFWASVSETEPPIAA